jgi:hypothetical protein
VSETSRSIEHVEAFNQAVTSGDWETFAERFATDARMEFVGVPAGPFEGRTAIAAAYRAGPPTETMVVLADDDPTVRFQWSSGDTGTMGFSWTETDQVQSLTVTFD